jgi:hypothetical protein
MTTPAPQSQPNIQQHQHQPEPQPPAPPAASPSVSERLSRAGRRPLPSDRAIVADLLWAAAGIPFIPLSKTLHLPELSALRERAQPRIAWAVILMKAYSAVALRRPPLRQVYMRFPWPHLYEHSDNIALLTISREYQGSHRLFFARFASPESKPLVLLQRDFEAYRRDPIGSIRQFKHQASFARWPWFIRRAVWLATLSLSGRKRVTNFGTFGVSLSRLRAADLAFHLAPASTLLGVDPAPAPQGLRLTLTFDHRLIDGWPAAGVLEELEAQLRGPITDEIRSLPTHPHQSSDPTAGDSPDDSPGDTPHVAAGDSPETLG